MPDDKPKRKAVIVGINEYKDKYEQGRGFTTLEGAENDAKDFKARLEDTENPEFNYDIHYLTGSNATCAKIRKALSDVFWKAEEPCDIALFYFSGHGKEVVWYDEGYIAPYDMLFEDPFIYGIKMSELRHVISKSPHKCTITILDCCYSGHVMKDKGDSYVADKFDERVKDFVAEGRIILASSGEDQKSREITKEHEILIEHEGEEKLHPHGAFTYFLIEGIDRGYTTLYELNKYVTKEMEMLNQGIYNCKNQQCYFLASGSSDLEKTTIARSHVEKNKKIIDSYIKIAEDHFGSCNTHELIVSVVDIQKALEIYPKSQEALDVKNKIISSLEYCRNKVEDWIVDNTFPSSDYILKNFKKLKDLARDVNYEGIVRRSKNKRDISLLINLCLVGVGELSQDEFIETIKRYVSPSSPVPTKKDYPQVYEKLPREIQVPDSTFIIPNSSDKEKFLENKTSVKSLKSNDTF